MTVSSSHAPGYKNLTSTPMNHEILASTQFQTIPVSIDVASRDWGNPDGSTHLRPGLCLGYDSSSGRYKTFRPALHPDTTVVVLAEEVRDIDTVTTQVGAIAFNECVLKSGKTIEYNDSAALTPGTVVWTDCQRIKIRDNA